MNPGDVLAERSEVSRRVLILDDAYNVICSQRGGTLEDEPFGFRIGARLPAPLEEAVKSAICAWCGTRCPPALMLVGRALAMRVFPLDGDGRHRIGVLLERYRRRAGDPPRHDL